ncbi:MAG: DVU_1556 family methyltransferase [Syntrophobacteraceae bacterium]
MKTSNTMGKALNSDVYEKLAANLDLDGTLRPGGFELADKALDLCRFDPEARLLDIGCGTGATVGYLIRSGKIRACGLDLSFSLLERGRRGADHLPLLRGDGECLPFASAAFDGVLAECALSVMGNHNVVLGECKRVLKKNAYLIVSDIYSRGSGFEPEQSDVPSESRPSKILSMGQLRRTLELHGFAPCFWEDRSGALKNFAARIILAGGSIGSLWNALCGGEAAEGESATVAPMPGRTTVGYFSLIAQKKE